MLRGPRNVPGVSTYKNVGTSSSMFDVIKRKRRADSESVQAVGTRSRVKGYSSVRLLILPLGAGTNVSPGIGYD